jgi:hypothetical protein
VPSLRFFIKMKQDLSRPGEGTLSLTVFLTLCVLGLGFMIYAFFQWTYGDKRRALARQLAAHKNALKERSSRPFLVAHTRPLLDHKSTLACGNKVTTHLK